MKYVVLGSVLIIIEFRENVWSEEENFQIVSSVHEGFVFRKWNFSEAHQYLKELYTFLVWVHVFNLFLAIDFLDQNANLFCHSSHWPRRDYWKKNWRENRKTT